MSEKKKPVLLVICDGWGVGASDPEGIKREGNAVAMAATPVRDSLLRDCSWNLLETSGKAVGLPHGQMGNSEVGHLNLGAGRVVYQSISRISISIREGHFNSIPALTEMAKVLAHTGGTLNLMGLVSDGGVHSDITHLWALMAWANRHEIPVRIHCFTDGRDTSPTSGLDWIRQIQQRANASFNARIASISGRYYAMDRDKRWARMEDAYRAIALGEGNVISDPVNYMESQYAQGITDEFIVPAVLEKSQESIAGKDGILFFNFRADRARQITWALTEEIFPHFDRGRGPIPNMVTMTQYEDDSPHPVLFEPIILDNVLGQVLEAAGKTQLRAAETEKYPHVTYFFNGGIEAPLAGEDRVMAASPKVATYDLKPEMSAKELTDSVIAQLQGRDYDFVLVNYANPDMVGHTGNIPAAIQAVEMTDGCVGRLLECVKNLGGSAFITADHGNAEKMLDEHGRPFTAHTIYPVQFIYVPAEADGAGIAEGVLADVAPTVLEALGIPQPAEMTGASLLRHPSP